MDRFFCLLSLCLLLFFSAGRPRCESAQPVFFSLLFPQLVPDSGKTATPDEAVYGEAFL